METNRDIPSAENVADFRIRLEEAQNLLRELERNFTTLDAVALADPSLDLQIIACEAKFVALQAQASARGECLYLDSYFRRIADIKETFESARGVFRDSVEDTILHGSPESLPGGLEL